MKERNISLLVKREDLNHLYLSGNKWHKLKYNLEEAKNRNKDTLLTFGGAYSNHIYAVAAAGKIFDFKTIGIIRGEEHKPLNPTLSFASENGMNLYYFDRLSYRKKESPEILEKLKKIFGDFYHLPEGGSNSLAVKGCSEIMNKINVDFDYICCPCGTGGTFAGLVTRLNRNKFALGFAVLKGASFLKLNVKTYLKSLDIEKLNNWDINLDYHFGGYGRFNKELLEFTKKFNSSTQIPVEPIYTGKMFYGIFDLINKGFFKEGTKIVALHTGGLQGFEGLKKSKAWKKINSQ